MYVVLKVSRVMIIGPRRVWERAQVFERIFFCVGFSVIEEIFRIVIFFI